MPEYAIGATELRQKLTDIIQRVREENATYVVESFGRPQVVILSLDDYRALQRARRALAGEQTELAKTSFGLWAERPELDDTWLKAGREQWQSDWRETDSDDG